MAKTKLSTCPLFTYVEWLRGGLHRAGVPVLAGTDVGVPGHTLHRELEHYVKAGLTPLEAIQAATITPARLMKLDNEVGTIEPDRRSDLIILDADPLETTLVTFARCAL